MHKSGNQAQGGSRRRTRFSARGKILSSTSTQPAIAGTQGQFSFTKFQLCCHLGFFQKHW